MWVRAHAQRGGGWLLALSRLSLSARLEFVGATLSLEGTSLGGRKAGCSVSLPTSWCMGRRLCDVMARWTSAFEGGVDPSGRASTGRVPQGPAASRLHAQVGRRIGQARAAEC